jgi:hypothetical protein
MKVESQGYDSPDLMKPASNYVETCDLWMRTKVLNSGGIVIISILYNVAQRKISFTQCYRSLPYFLTTRR